MKNLIVTLLLCFPFFINSFAQADSTIQKLTVYKTFGGVHYEYQKDTAIFSVSPKQVKMILKDNPLALVEFKKAKTSYNIAGILGFMGGVMIAFPVGTAIAGGEPEWGLAAGGAALLLSTIPFTSAYRHHSLEAVDRYNEKHTAFKPRAKYYFSGLGARLVVKF